jgi:putative tryptophan/tyrosine transport system substrate-binding protein
MRRRDFALSLASLTVLPPGELSAQSPSRLPKVALLLPDTPDYAGRPASNLYNLLQALAELGYVDGENVLFEFRFANHELERLPALAAELVATKPDVLWTFTSGGVRAAAAATSTIPIVVAPVNEGTLASLVPDFARPPGNITGLTLNSREQHEKCLQLLKEAAPSVTRVGMLLNPLNPVWENYPDILADAARALDVALVRMQARGTADLDQAFVAAAAQGVDGLFALSDSTLISSRTPAFDRILELTASFRLPSISDEDEFAEDGGLLELSSDPQARNRGAAEYIDRILQGGKVADLPVVLPSKFILVVNLKTAHELGIAIPPSILLRADEVIE